MTGTTTLDGEGQTDAVFLFQVDAALAIAAGSRVTPDGRHAPRECVLGHHGKAVTAGADSFLAGTIMGRAAVGLGARTQLVGRALSQDTVSLTDDAVLWTTP